ncbi:carbonic anhydrase [Streptomyces niveus]|uniref:carbonic anhydrase n=1 Tax=Streptomyces niveus TaxID=193462 RepID=UPI0036D22AF0
MERFRDHARTYSARAAAYSVDLDRLAEEHAPHVMIITCSDARLAPSLITGSRPGDLLELRTHGGTVPRFDPEDPSGEASTIEFAVEGLRIADIIVCGHSHCEAVGSAGTAGDITAAGHWHVVQQLDVLSDYPCVAPRLVDGTLRLHAWFHEVGTGATLQHRPGANAFLPL